MTFTERSRRLRKEKEKLKMQTVSKKNKIQKEQKMQNKIKNQNGAIIVNAGKQPTDEDLDFIFRGAELEAHNENVRQARESGDRPFMAISKFRASARRLHPEELISRCDSYLKAQERANKFGSWRV